MTRFDYSAISPEDPFSDDYAQDITNAGLIVGYRFYPAGHFGGRSEPWIIQDGVRSNLAITEVPLSAFAFGANDRGDVVGYYQDFGGNPSIRGFVYSHGSYIAVDVPGGTATYVYGINDDGDLVGSFYDGQTRNGFLRSDGAFTTISVQGASETYLTEINDAGLAAGYYLQGTIAHGFIYDNGAVTPVDLPGSSSTYLTGLNNYGEALGYATTLGGVTQTFLYHDGQFTFLPSDLNASPLPAGLNDEGQIVSANRVATPHVNETFRFYDTVTTDHFYTASAADRDAILAQLPTYVFEGAPWGTPDEGARTIDVFRFFDTATGAHFFTESTFERDEIIRLLPSYTYEGVAFQAYAELETTNQFALVRFYNTVSKVHHYAADEAEVRLINSGAVGQGWIEEGEAFVVHRPITDMFEV